MNIHSRFVAAIWMMTSAGMGMAQESALLGVLEYAATNPPAGSLTEAELEKTPFAQKKNQLGKPLLKAAYSAEVAGDYRHAAMLQLRCVLVFDGSVAVLERLAEYLEKAGDTAGAIGAIRHIVAYDESRSNTSDAKTEYATEAKSRLAALNAQLKLTDAERSAWATESRKHADFLFNKGEYFTAMLLYRKAEELATNPETKWQVAVCLDRWGLGRAAIPAYQDFLSSVPVGNQEPQRERINEAKARIKAISQRLAMQQ